MKNLFLALLVVHGLIHMLGLIKGLDLFPIKALVRPISKPEAILWLTACILFIAVAILWHLAKPYWWVVGFSAIVISQTLIVLSWTDARYGTMVNILFLILCIGGFATWKFHNRYMQDVASSRVFREEKEELLTEADLEHIPEPVRRYIEYTRSIGKPKVSNFRVSFVGRLRKDEASAWMPFSSEQHNFMQTPTRLFFMKAVMKHLPVAGYHQYRNADALMDIRIFSLFTVQFQEGIEMDIAETVTFFNDMCCMAPATLIDNRIQWLKVEGNQVKSSFTTNGITITAWLYFNDEGQLINFISNDRYSAAAGKRVRWSTPLKDYQLVNGYRIATSAETIYTESNKDFCYGTFQLANIEYNVKDRAQ